MTELGGIPSGDFLVWSNREGIYGYGGGRQAPKDFTVNNIKNYWQQEITLPNKESAIGIYGRVKNEYYTQVGNTLIALELNFGRFRKYDLGFRIVEYVGTVDGQVHILGANGKVYKFVGERGGTALLPDAFIEYHNHANYAIPPGSKIPVPLSEGQDKILQELYMSGDSETSANQSLLTIIADENILPDIAVFSVEAADEIMSPLLVRYGKVRFKITFQDMWKLIEFGYTFSTPDQAPGMKVLS
jgi:hypothetical protein